MLLQTTEHHASLDARLEAFTDRSMALVDPVEFADLGQRRVPRSGFAARIEFDHHLLVIPERLDQLGQAQAGTEETIRLLAGPYAVWGNRELGEMDVWLPEDPKTPAPDEIENFCVFWG